MKKFIAIVAVCMMITGCSARTENYKGSEAIVAEEVSSGAKVEDAKSDDDCSESLSETSSTANDRITSDVSDTLIINDTEVKGSGATVSDVGDTSMKEEITTSEANESQPQVEVSTSEEVINSEPEESVIAEPKWSETESKGTKYINANGVYSRKIAVVGSEAVKKYSVNDKVSIIAVTDTGYYKLEDGTFIHQDYLSSKEIKVVEKPTTSSGVTDKSAETLLNSVALKPMKTNNDTVDARVSEILKKVTTDKMSTYQKVKAVYDYIISASTYGTPKGVYGYEPYVSDMDRTVVTESRFLLDEGVGVCNNYAALFTVLTRRIGLESYYVTGQVASRNGGMTGHAWSIIKLSGEYYIFDTQIEQSNTSGAIGYNWFCKKDTSMSGTYSYIPSREVSVASFGGFVLEEERDYSDLGGKVTPIEGGYIIEYEDGSTETVHSSSGTAHDIESILNMWGISMTN